MPADSSLLRSVAVAVHDAGWDLEALGLAWARVSPTVILVPAFGLRALPVIARGSLSLFLALTLFPVLVVHDTALDRATPWPLALLIEVMIGLPPALAAAIPLWAATMAGGLVDNLRGGQGELQLPVIEGRTGQIGVLFGLLASTLFLLSGGPARTVGLLLAPPVESVGLLAGVAGRLAGSITLALNFGAPLLAASFLVEITLALIAKASSPAQMQAQLAPLRAVALLGVCALVFDRLAVVLGAHVAAAP